MRRRRFSKRLVRYFWLLTALFLVFASVRLRPLSLSHAAQTGNVSLARFALKMGVDPNTQTSRVEGDDVMNALVGRHIAGGCGCPVLLEAASYRSSGVVRLLLDAGADPNRGDGAMPPLMAAVIGGDTECVRLLLLHGADPNGHYKDSTSVLESAPPKSVISAMLKRAGAKN